jgi:esterase/lipase superfamily enzyme
MQVPVGEVFMYIITNRKVDPSGTGLKKLGTTISEKGPNELRLVKATKAGKEWRITVLPDKMTNAMKREIGIPAKVDVFSSRYVAKKVLNLAREKNRAVVIFVHGYNNDIEDVLERADGLSRNYNVEVLPFSWPANGGGVLNISGTLSYKSDKRDALASVGALNQTLAKLQEILDETDREIIDRITAVAHRRYPRRAEIRDSFIAEKAEQECHLRINLMLHSMGNYLFKHLLKSSVYEGTRLLFDNVLLVAADTNNKDHAQWVDKIQCRNRVYITINEMDKALRASRIKAGEEQQARLGHFPYNLYSQQAVYVNFTRTEKVGDSHAYFEGHPIENDRVRGFFAAALNGETAEIGLPYDESTRMYMIPG